VVSQATKPKAKGWEKKKQSSKQGYFEAFGKPKLPLFHLHQSAFHIWVNHHPYLMLACKHKITHMHFSHLYPMIEDPPLI
jgi:hypothetical protein